jgi:hypothetical protein
VTAVNEFLSEENIAMHREYLRNKRLRYSILESSIPTLKGAGVRDIMRMRLDPRDKRDALLLLPEIKAHEIFFSSFSEARFPHSDTVSDGWGNEAAFLNEIFRQGMSLTHGFVCVYLSGSRITVKGFGDLSDVFRLADPVLAVDVSEHAYFLDYGFDRERYLISALPYLDLIKLIAADI